jgi:hypothetical protein
VANGGSAIRVKGAGAPIAQLLKAANPRGAGAHASETKCARRGAGNRAGPPHQNRVDGGTLAVAACHTGRCGG